MNEKISVLMGVYNCADTLEAAVLSIQLQTYKNWELILCDDGSTDNTYDVALELSKKDSRIILLRNDFNHGLNYTLNRCLANATGKYIARMDGDDYCLSTRFERQVFFLRTNSEFSIVSTPMILFDENGEWGCTIVVEKPDSKDIISGSPICHAPVMMYKKCLDDVKGYTEDKKMLRVEDVNLWIKLYARGYRCYNLAEPLYKMRNDKNALNRRKYRFRINSTYVRLLGCKMLKLNWKYYILSFKPMIIGLIPAKIRQIIRQKQKI